MPQGIQIWNDAGVLVCDYTTRMGFILGMITVTTGNQSGSTTNANLPEGDLWYVAMMNASGGDPGEAPILSKSGITLTWNRYHPSHTWQGILLYGIR